MLVDLAVADRYAHAFVNLLGKAHRLETGLKELKLVARTYADSKDLQRFLGSPEIAPDEKEGLLSRLWSDLTGQEGMALLHLLLKHDRMETLPAIWEEAVSVAEARQGIVRGQVFTAHPISSSETEAIGAAIGKLLGKKIVLERAVDKTLIGGVRVTVGTTLLDGSVQTYLEDIRRQLISIKVTT